MDYNKIPNNNFHKWGKTELEKKVFPAKTFFGMIFTDKEKIQKNIRMFYSILAFLNYFIDIYKT